MECGGSVGTVRFKHSHFTDVVTALKAPILFYVDGGAVAWPGDLDVAPDAMYQAIKARGEWMLC